MTEPSMLSLFESDADFLDDITGGANVPPGPPATMGPAGMQNPMGPRLPQNTPPQYTPLGGGQKMQHYNSQYDQFTQQQKFAAMGDGRQAGMSQMLSTSPQQPFGSPPTAQGPRMQSPGPTFQGYGMHGNTQQVTPPQQVQQQGQQRAQMVMSPGPGAMWNQGNGMQQGNKAMPGQVPYVQQQQQPSSQAMASYMSPRDYNSLSTSHPAAQAPSQMNRFPSQQSRQMYGRPPMGSPPPSTSQRLSHMPISNQGNMDPSAANQFPANSQSGMLGGQGTPGMLSNMNNYPSNAQPRGMMPGANMQGMPMRSNTPAYPYGGPQGQLSQVQAQQQAGLQAQQQAALQSAPQGGLPRVGQVPTNGPMSPYQSQNSGQNPYRQPFPGMPQQQGGMHHPMQSSQQPLAPTTQQMPPHSGSSAQGFNSQPGITHQRFGSYGAQYNINRTSASLSQPSSVSGVPGVSNNSTGGIVTSANSAPVVSAPLAVVTGNVPNQQPPQSITPNMQALDMEIQQLQGQVQQLYQMPQTPETQQKMLDLQERARSLRGQQQTQLLLQQRNQQQQQPQAPQMMSPGQSSSMPPVCPTNTVPVRQSAPNLMMQQQLSPMLAQVRPIAPAPPPAQQLSPINQQQAPAMQQLQQSMQSVAEMPQLAATPTPPPPQLSSVESELGLFSTIDQQAPPSIPSQADQQSEFNSQPVTPVMFASMLEDYPGAGTPQMPGEPKFLDKAQDKSQKIMEEAIAKAKAEGRDIPTMVTEDMMDEEGKAKKKKKPRKKKDDLGDKTPKEKKERKPKKPKDPNKSPKPKKSKAKKDGEIKAITEAEGGIEFEKLLPEGVEGEEVADIKPKPEKKKSIKPSRPKKKKPPATFLKKIKKRKRNDSSGSEVEIGGSAAVGLPPGSPLDDDKIEKRRSGRVTKRKKYLDDIELNLSEEDTPKKGEQGGNDAPILQPVQFFVDNPAEEEAQIVEKILGNRMAMRKFKRMIEIPVQQEKIQPTDNPTEEVDIMGSSVEDAALNKSVENGDSPENITNQAETTIPFGEESDTITSLSQTTDDRMVIEPIRPLEGLENQCEETQENTTQIDNEAETCISQKLEEKPEDPEDYEELEVEEFFVKYKNFSYLHCEWRTADELELGDKRIHQKIKRFKIKKSQTNMMFINDDDELFNMDYTEVDRVLDVSLSTDPLGGETITHYLVKWSSLPYEDSTWELGNDVDRSKIEAFARIREPPSEEDREYKPRPKASQWKQLDETPQYKNGNRLREYQLEGINWLTFCWYNKQNCILADEMGLGKTIQSITFLQEIVNYGMRGPFLVIVPLSTIANWQREFERWTDLNAVVYHGSAPSRNMIQEYEMYYKDEAGRRIPDIYRFHALITTYEMVISDMEMLTSIEWRATIIDEAHRLKNKKCRLAEGLKLFDLEHRVLLTGTPLQNNVEELFALLNFLEPQRFNSTESFLAEFGDLKTESQVDKLKALLKPMMLRRLKEDVEKNLAAKEETIIEVELTNIQKKYYRAILERNFSFLSKGTGSMSNVPNLMNTMMELRKCCNHPYLVKGAEDKIQDDMKHLHVNMNHTESTFHAMVHSCGKLVLLDKLLPKLKANGHKVLIFSQMIRVLDILEDYLIHRQYLYERLDGRIRGNIRQEAIDRFSKPDSDRFVFLLCTRAGGLGINLTAADTVIIYDSDWNPQNDLQAQARCHRIGQEKMVKVYRLITRNSYEREMFDKASLKLGLDKAVLQGAKENGNPQQQMSKKEVEDLLKKGAYGALMDDDTSGDQFCEEDIDQILQRRTQVIQIESEGKGSMFAKASFNMSSNRTDIDIDDPNFWQKWATKADLDADYLTNRNDLIIEQPRVRKQTSRFGGQDAALEISDLESSDSGDEDGSGQGKNKKGKGSRSRKARSREEDFEPGEEITGSYLRAECFKVEKHLLVYGWGRWEDILVHGRFKRKMEPKDVIVITKAMLLYSLLHYHGDERIKGFIWDLVNAEEGAEMDYRNHSGLSAPVPRGRKGKKKQKEQSQVDDWDFSKCDIVPNEVLVDEGYKKHLKRHANKVLLRVRLLYYLKQEIIADQVDKIFSNYHVNEIDIPPPCPDGEPPMYWWDEEADKSILVGVFKHGYEKYNIMRQDPMLCFLDKCGPPDSAALLKEQNDEDNLRDDIDDEPVTATPKRRRGRPPLDDDYDMYMDSSPAPSSKAPTPSSQPQIGYEGKLPFPGASELNTRLRRVITGYQRNYKKQQLKDAQKAKKMERRKTVEAAVKEREYMRKSQQQSRWSRREEADFYRVVSTFGVERDRKTGLYTWDTFRSIARLDKKYDDTLTEYYLCFYHMCKRVCRKFKTEEEAIPPSTLYVEPITEERANRCLARVDLLNKVREYILWHPKLKERLKLCQPSYDMPEWWIPGDHDLDLLIGAAKHGLARTDLNILHDPKLCFKELVKMKAEELSSMYRSLRSNRSGDGPETPTKSESRTQDENEPEPGEVIRESPHKNESPKPKSLVKTDTPTKEEVSEHYTSKTPEQEESGDLSPEKHEQSNSLPSDISPKKEIKCEEDEIEQGEIVSHVKQESSSSQCDSSIKNESGNSDIVKQENDVETENDIKTENDAEDMTVKSESKNINGDLPETKTEGEEQDQETFQAKFERTDMYPGMEASFMEPEPGEITSTATDIMARAMGNPAVQWPKDRVIYHRLENVCHCIEQGEWPFPRRPPSTHPLYMTDSRASTPNGTPSSTPKPDAGDRSETPDSGLDRASVKQADGLKMTFHKKRGRRRKRDIEAEGGRLSELVNMPSDCDSESNMSGLQSETDVVQNGATFPYSGLSPRQKLEEQMERMQQQLQLQQIQQIQQLQAAQSVSAAGVMDMMPKKRRGRKRKVDKLLEEQAAALMAAQQAHKEATMQPESDLDAHVPVVSLEDGHRLSGEEAPTRRELALWLEQNPKYIVERPIETADDEYEPGMIRGHKKHRRPRVDPYKLDLESLTGEENVSVINKETGKKITGAKAPPLKYLKQWLEQNPTFNVDPKWSHVVRAMGSLSEEMMKDRVPEPHGRRGRRSENTSMSSIMADYSNYAAAAGMGAFSGLNPLMSGFPKMPFPMGYGGIAGMNLASMYGLGSGFGLLPGGLTGKSEEESEEKEAGETEESTSPSKSKTSTSTGSSSTTPHPSFPFMYNPMMFNPLLAQSMGSFSLPSTLPTSFATLAQAGSSGVNGVEDSDVDNVEQAEATDGKEQEQEVAQDLTVKKSPTPKLSTPRKERKHKHPMKIEYANPEPLDEPMNLSSKPSAKASNSRESPPLDGNHEQAAIDSDGS